MDTSNLVEPNAEISEKDHLVGEADVDLRKLYSLAISWEKTAIETLVAARYINSKTDQEQRMEKANELRKKSEIMMEIFWISLKDSFDLWQKQSIGIRKNWKVVWSEPEVPPILGILGDLFGR
jgi:DNA-binding transcriptional regulator/RsmH inhibitor MraZ